MRRLCARALIVTAAIVLIPAVAQAEHIGRDDRPSGFALELDIGVSTSMGMWFWEEFLLAGGTSLTPRLSLGAQFGRIAFGLQTAINFQGVGETGEEADSTIWNVRLGPWVDGEIWTHPRAALFLFGGITALIMRFDEEFDASGFALDFGLGGRYYVAPQFSIGIKVGSTIDIWFFEEDEYSLLWSIYGALAFRFVASR